MLTSQEILPHKIYLMNFHQYGIELLRSGNMGHDTRMRENVNFTNYDGLPLKLHQ